MVPVSPSFKLGGENRGQENGGSAPKATEAAKGFKEANLNEPTDRGVRFQLDRWELLPLTTELASV